MFFYIRSSEIYSIFAFVLNAIMRQIIYLAAISFLFFSCKKSSTSNYPGNNTQEKMYYQGSPDNVLGPEEIFSANIDGSGEKQLTDFSGGWVRSVATQNPLLSPDGKTLYFVSGTENRVGEIFSMSTDGSNVKKIISNNITGSSLRDPFLFQNGQKITFCQEIDSFWNRHGEIFTANIDGSDLKSHIVFPADGNCYHPCVNPANTTILYTNLVGSSMRLYTMNIDGSNKKPLTTSGPNVQRHSEYSPDGARIIFDAWDNGGHSEIYIMNADGTNIVQLTNYGAVSWGATFSKDGNSIYFSSDEFNGHTSQIYKMKTDGTDKTKITSGALDKFNVVVK